MDFEEYRSYDALGLAELVATKEVSAAELLGCALAAADDLNPVINAFVHTFADAARDDIRDGLPDGPFTGVPFAIKDLFTDVQGQPTSNGSALWAGAVADHDCELVRRYRQAGLVITAKTNTPELGLNASTEPAQWGPTHNPWALGFSSGGSSGGSAAAVAAGIIPMAHATDGGGSIRIPSTFCGLFGLKPTRGRVSLAPDRGEGWNGLSVAHVVAKSVRDSAAALDATHGYVPGDPYSAPGAETPGGYLPAAATDPGPLRIGLITTSPVGTPVDPAILAVIEESARRCEQLGHHVERVEWPAEIAQVMALSGAISSAHVATAVAKRLSELGREQQDGDLEPVVAMIAGAGTRIPATAYVQAVEGAHALSRAMARLLGPLDVVMTPTLCKPAPAHGLLKASDMDRFQREVHGMTDFTAIANVSGQPAMSVPLDLGPDGRPIGTHVFGRFGDERTLFQLAGQLERAHGFVLSHHTPALA